MQKTFRILNVVFFIHKEKTFRNCVYKSGKTCGTIKENGNEVCLCYVLFISKLCKGHAAQLLSLMHDDEHYYVQMGQAWLIAELAVHEPEAVYQWFKKNDLKYNINGKSIQKICDSFRISDDWKAEIKKLRHSLRERR